jgi:glycosyltransferase involved in cell wall biosynthesis
MVAGVGFPVKRLLAISWAMPPAVFPRSIQVARSLTALARQGWATTVLARTPDETATRDPALASRYAGIFDLDWIDDVAGGEPSWLRRILRTPAPTRDDLWIDRAVSRGLELARTRGFDAVASFAQPWTDHEIGLRLNRAAGLPWLAHFSDPWVDSPYLAHLAPDARAAMASRERAVVETADALAFTNRQTVDLVMGKYPAAWRAKVTVVPHGFEDSIPYRPAGTGPLRIVHTGDLYGLRSPDVLIEGLGRLSARRPLAGNLVVELVGSVPDDTAAKIDAAGLTGIVALGGRRTAVEAGRAAEAADVLLLIDAPARTSVFLPSKLIDYLAYGRLILGLTPSDGASADVLRETGGLIVDPTDPEAVSLAVCDLLDRAAGGRLHPDPSCAQAVSRYQIDQTTRALADALDFAMASKVR